MMRVRRAKRTAEPNRFGSVQVEGIPFEGIAELVTLEDPTEDPGRARNAFARLRPPADHPEDETRSWRDSVAAQAIAVRVLPPPRRAAIPLPALAALTPAVGIREESLRLAAETGDPAVLELTESVLAEVGG